MTICSVLLETFVFLSNNAMNRFDKTYACSVYVTISSNGVESDLCSFHFFQDSFFNFCTSHSFVVMHVVMLIVNVTKYDKKKNKIFMREFEKDAVNRPWRDRGREKQYRWANVLPSSTIFKWKFIINIFHTERSEERTPKTEQSNNWAPMTNSSELIYHIWIDDFMFELKALVFSFLFLHFFLIGSVHQLSYMFIVHCWPTYTVQNIWCE